MFRDDWILRNSPEMFASRCDFGFRSLMLFLFTLKTGPKTERNFDAVSATSAPL